MDDDADAGDEHDRGCRSRRGERDAPLGAAEREDDERNLEPFEQRSGLPVVVNTSLNTAGRPMVDDLKDALECFGSTPVDLMAIGPFVLRRQDVRA